MPDFSALVKKTAGSIKSDYIEARIEDSRASLVRFSGNELDDIGTRNSLGGCVRILNSNGWGFSSFNDVQNIRSYAKLTLSHANRINLTEKINLKFNSPFSKTVQLIPKNDPAKHSLTEKYEICRKYNNLLKKNKKIVNTVVYYLDRQKKIYFANSNGDIITTSLSFCGILLKASSRDGMNVQHAFFTKGDYNGFHIVENLEETCGDVVKNAVDLLNAVPVKPGKYTVIIDPELCGTFTHEAFGHLSEADFVYENDDLKKIMKLGKRFGPDELSIIDNPTLKNLGGSYSFDNEGVKSQKTFLIKNGILTGRLHSRETAAKMNEKLTGNARSINYQFPPIVRMSNTYMAKGPYSKEEIFEKTGNAIYAKGSLGGMTNTEMFTFTAEDAYLVKRGKIKNKLRDVILTGNVFTTLKNIDMIGSDLTFFGGLGGCGKGGQSPLPISDGGPHIRIQNVVIGGK